MMKTIWRASNNQLNDRDWILGGTDRINWEAQADIDWRLEAKAERD